MNPSSPPSRQALSPSGPGRFSRSLARCGVAVDAPMQDSESALDDALRAALRAFGRVKLRIEADLPRLDDLLLCDEDSPAPGQLADIISAARQMAQMLQAQARDTQDLLQQLGEAARAAHTLGLQAQRLRADGAAPVPGEAA